MKKWIALLLVAVMVFSLAACEKDDSTTDSTNSSVASQQSDSNLAGSQPDASQPSDSADTQPEEPQPSESEDTQPDASQPAEPDASQPDDSEITQPDTPDASQPADAGHAHSYKETVTKPTCTQKGYTTYTCTCGDSYTDKETAELGHNYVNGSCKNCGATSAGSVGLKYSLATDASAYYVVGIGTCTDTNIIIPETYEGLPVTALANFALSNGTMTSVTIPSSVTSIGGHIFANSYNLSSIIVAPENTVYYSKNNCIIDTAKKQLVAGCKTSVIPADGSVTSIGLGAFQACKDLKNITIPDTVTSIEKYAFCACDGLTEIRIPASVTSIGKYALSDCANLVSLVVDTKNPVYHSEGNCVIQTAAKTIVVGCKTSVIPENGSVTAIGESAFDSCEDLTTIAIPESVTSIGEAAFQACKQLETITLPSGVTNIQKSAFSGCTALTSIRLPEKLTTIGEYAFTACAFSSISIPASVTSIQECAFMGCDNLKSIVFPEGISIVNDDMFYKCTNLTTVTLPASVTEIELFAFRYCESLTRINFGGTKAQWAAIEKGVYWDANTGAYTVYCTDGEITKS